jgi:hypothetical protein
LYEPALIMGPGVTILDGNHRIVRRWDLGERLIPAYRLPDTLTEAVHHMSNRPGAGGPF